MLASGNLCVTNYHKMVLILEQPKRGNERLERAAVAEQQHTAVL